MITIEITYVIVGPKPVKVKMVKYCCNQTLSNIFLIRLLSADIRFKYLS